MTNRDATITRRLGATVDRSAGPDGCWPWRGARNARGYGRVYYAAGRYVHAHRAAYEAARGPVPPGGILLHSCDNPPCCNPAHLSVGTRADNSADMAAKGRGRQASRIALAMMVLYIYGDLPSARLAAVAGVSVMTARRARKLAGLAKGHRWLKRQVETRKGSAGASD